MTVGLLSMMAPSGLFIPAHAGSKVTVLSDLFADIGDEQSIEQSLSTFSSHMNNIVDIVENAGPGKLILLDELGAGTDPTEGAALAISIIEELMSRGAMVMATTHYTELKKYALSRNGVENGSMQFDVETLSPTYKLMLGIPGKSNAFEISKKLGLSGEIIDRAKGLLEGKDLEFEDVLSSIEADRKAAEAERDEAIMLNIEMKRRQEELEKKAARFEKQKERMLEQAREEARGIIEDARLVSEDVKQELKELAKIESLGERNRKFDENRKRIKDAAGRYKEIFIVETNDNPVDIRDVKVGDRVKVMTLGQNGEILSLPDDKGEMMVQVGMMKIRAAADDLKLINDGRKKKKPASKATYGNLAKSKAQTVKTSIDVRGQSLDEARANVAKYIDDACLAKVPEVTIIHGKGQGVLSKGLRAGFKKDKRIAEFAPGSLYEGGDGVTVIKFK
jgi:DNA mismatch repair protein MutS2